MFKKAIETIVGGTVGLLALYVVAKTAYSAGCDMTEAELHYKELSAKKQPVLQTTKKPLEIPDPPEAADVPISTVTPIGTRKKIGMLFGLKRSLKRGASNVLRDLMNDPEAHRMEAYVDGDEVRVNIRKKPL